MMNEVVKREELVDVFRKGKFEWLAFIKTMLEGNREVSWCEVNVINLGVQEAERSKERVAVLMNDLWHSSVIDFGCITSKTL